MNLRPVFKFIGRLLLLLAAAQLLPLATAAIYGEKRAIFAFALSAVLTAAAGGLCELLGAREETYRREGVLVVAFGWLLASIFGALPYMLAGTLVHPVDALFESASGFTTTGSTVLTDIAGSGKAILLWRSFTQWLGGMGIIVLFVALLPQLGPGARFLYKLEVPGPTAETLHPRVRDTAMVLWRIYLGLTVAETAILKLAGLSFYDALTHTFSTLSTGGFSPRNESVAAFGPLVQGIVIVFMILAGGNFSLYYGLFMRRGGNIFRDFEFRMYLLIIGGATLAIFADLILHQRYTASGTLLLDSLFQVVGVITTTGFATADFNLWPSFSQLLLVGLMFVGGCAGSTSGSMKVMRMLIGIKTAGREIKSIFSPSTISPILVSKKPVPRSVVSSVTGFFILFITSWAVGALLLTGPDRSVVTAATASIACLGNIGPGLEAVGPVENFAFFSAFDKLVMVLLMLAGRLELYSIAAILTFGFWRR